MQRLPGTQCLLETVLCDLDDCLYRSPELPELVRENIQSESERC